MAFLWGVSLAASVHVESCSLVCAILRWTYALDNVNLRIVGMLHWFVDLPLSEHLNETPLWRSRQTCSRRVRITSLYVRADDMSSRVSVSPSELTYFSSTWCGDPVGYIWECHKIVSLFAVCTFDFQAYKHDWRRRQGQWYCFLARTAEPYQDKNQKIQTSSNKCLRNILKINLQKEVTCLELK